MEKPKSPWSTYHERTKEAPPSKSLVEAIALVSEKDAALDVGAGALKDSKYLLQEGFDMVVALDSEPHTKEAAESIGDNRLGVIISSFEAFDFPTEEFDLVNAQYSLPFTPPESFDEIFEKMKGSLKEKGIFVGQLFGKNDDWKDRPNMTFHSLEEVIELLSGMKIIKLQEEEREGRTAAGDTKHWHVFDITARK
jgi:SAM-dependent methyltransferase